MEIITKYKAFDGVEFLSAPDCEEHEQNCHIANEIMKALPSRPNSCEFLNGEGYIQHDEILLLKVRSRLLEFVKRYAEHDWIQQSIDRGFDVDESWAGRIIGECCPDTVYKYWYRFTCIDSSFKEWGQPYYSTHPDEGEQNKLN